MSLKLLVDMNLSPGWVVVFERHGWQAIHWSSVGPTNAPDQVIMVWARTNGYVLFTHNLDFGAILAATGVDSPSVIQVRTQDTLPARLEGTVVAALRQYEILLRTGALVVVDEARSRARILPLRD